MSKKQYRSSIDELEERINYLETLISIFHEVVPKEYITKANELMKQRHEKNIGMICERID